jgi:transcriptional regulator with XRE-family HTH domain
MTKQRPKLDVNRLVRLRTVKKLSWTEIARQVGATAPAVEKLVRMRIEPGYAAKVAKWYAGYYQRRKANVPSRAYGPRDDEGV